MGGERGKKEKEFGSLLVKGERVWDKSRDHLIRRPKTILSWSRDCRRDEIYCKRLQTLVVLLHHSQFYCHHYYN